MQCRPGNCHAGLADRSWWRHHRSRRVPGCHRPDRGAFRVRWMAWSTTRASRTAACSKDTDPAVIRRVMEVNFFGAMQMTHAALPHLLARPRRRWRRSPAWPATRRCWAHRLLRPANTRCTVSSTPCAPRLRTAASASRWSAPRSSPPASAARRWAARAARRARPESPPGASLQPERHRRQRILDALAHRAGPCCCPTVPRAWRGGSARLAPGFYARTMKRRVGARI
jgi:hypothetical protein